MITYQFIVTLCILNLVMIIYKILLHTLWIIIMHTLYNALYIKTLSKMLPYFFPPQPHDSCVLCRSTPMRGTASAVLSPESTTRSCYCTSSSSTSDERLLHSQPPPLLPSAATTEYGPHRSPKPTFAFSHSFWKECLRSSQKQTRPQTSCNFAHVGTLLTERTHPRTEKNPVAH